MQIRDGDEGGVVREKKTEDIDLGLKRKKPE